MIDAINLSRTDKNAVLVDVRPKDCLLYTSSRQSWERPQYGWIGEGSDDQFKYRPVFKISGFGDIPSGQKDSYPVHLEETGETSSDSTFSACAAG